MVAREIRQCRTAMDRLEENKAAAKWHLMICGLIHLFWKVNHTNNEEYLNQIDKHSASSNNKNDEFKAIILLVVRIARLYVALFFVDKRRLSEKIKCGCAHIRRNLQQTLDHYIKKLAFDLLRLNITECNLV